MSQARTILIVLVLATLVTVGSCKPQIAGISIGHSQGGYSQAYSQGLGGYGGYGNGLGYGGPIGGYGLGGGPIGYGVGLPYGGGYNQGYQQSSGYQQASSGYSSVNAGIGFGRR